MNQSNIQTVVWIILALALVARAVWVIRRYNSQRMKRFIGWPTDARDTLGKFYWKEGIFSSEVTRAMSPDFARKYGWLLSHRAQRLIVMLNILSWALAIVGAFDLSWNLGFGSSPLSWWFVLVLAAYLLVRGSVRVIADAPDALLDERQIALRDNSYRVAYIWLTLIMFFNFGLLTGIAEVVAESESADFLIDGFVFGFSLLIFISASLPSMVLAWSGSVRER
jgi:hypothetical protein